MVLQRAARGVAVRPFAPRAPELEWKIHLGFKILKRRFHFVISHCFFSPCTSVEKGRQGERVVPKTRLVALTVCNEVTDDSVETTPTSLSSLLSFVSGV